MFDVMYLIIEEALEGRRKRGGLKETNNFHEFTAEILSVIKY